MPEGTEFLLAMKNGVSGPAKDAKASLQSLKDQLKGVDAQMKALQRANAIYKQAGPAFQDQVKKNNQALGWLKIQADDLKGPIKDLAPPTKSFGDKLTMAGIAGGVASAGLDIARRAFDLLKDAAMKALDVLIDWTLEGAKMAVEAGAFKESMTATYTLFAKSAKEGQLTFDKIDALGTAIHIPTAKAHEYAKDLIAEGITGKNRLEQSVKSVAMLQKVGGDAAAQKLKGILGEAAKSKQTAWWLGGRGVFTVTREQLVGTGVTVDEVYGALAKKLGKSVGEIRILMMQGRITADQGIDALNDVFERGKVGDAARKMTGDLSQVFTELKDNIGKILRDVDYKGFVQEIRGFAGMFDQSKASGKDMHDKLVKFFNGIFTAGKMAVRGLRIGFLELEIASLKLLIFLAPQIKEFKKLYDEFKKNGGQAILLSLLWTYLKGTAMVLAIGIKFMFAEFNAGFRILNGLLVPLNAVKDVIQKLSDLVSLEGWKGLGLDMMRGLIEGIKAGKDAVVGAVKGVATDALKGAKDTLGIKSPSKEMMKLGQYSAEGFEKGAEGMSFGKSTLRVDVPQSKGGGTFAPQVSITISGAQGPQAAWEEFEQKATDWLEKLRLQFAGGHS